MRRLAIFVVRRPWWILVAALVLLPIAAGAGAGVHDRLSTGGLADQESQSSRAATQVAEKFRGASQSDFVVLVTARGASVDAPDVKEAGLRLTRRLSREPGVVTSSSYWSLGNAAPLRSRTRHQALVIGSLSGGADRKLRTAARLSPRYTLMSSAVTTAVTGQTEVLRQVSDQAEQDLQRSELVTAPVTFLALVVVFGGMVAALLPLSVGIVAVIGTFAILTLLTLFTDVSVFALNLTTGLGLGLAIDYSLFVVSRYREELARGASPRVAIGRTMQTAGRTVAFSAATVMISLLALLVFPVIYLRSFAYAGVAVVALAAVASIVVLPAVLVVLGPRVESGRLRKTRGESRFWRGQANRVMRHPKPYAIGVSVVLLALAFPFLQLHAGLTDDRVVPARVSSRAATDQIRHHFATREADALQVSVPNAEVTDRAAVDHFARLLAALPGVARVDASTGYYLPSHGTVQAVPPNTLSRRFLPDHGNKGTWLSVVPDLEPLSAKGEALVRHIRAVDAPFPFTVAGPSARLVDTKHSVIGHLPLALGLIAAATFVLLFLMTGSVLVPLKALLLNILSLTATFGAMVWVFQDGHLSGLLHFTPTGSVDVFTPILMFCIAFGLSMDYEVFLLSRIKEEYDLDRNNDHAVAVGLQKTGRIVTAAALLLTIVFVGIATSEVALLKLFGVGLTLAVLIDAFLIRATLVPAFMTLAGKLNWWSPRRLRRWHLRWGIWENEPIGILDREFENVH